jgi:FixJ family two-component response regulator
MLIYLIEDENVFKIKFKIVLEMLGVNAEIVSFNNADNFIAFYQEKLLNDEKKPQYIFCDFILKGSSINGLDLIQKFNKQLGNNVIVGIISGINPDSTLIRKAKENGANFWVRKGGKDMIKRMRSFKDDFIDNNHYEFKIY